MSRAAVSIRVFGVLWLVFGTFLLLVPHTLVPVSGFPPPNPFWLRLAGTLVFIAGYYYVQASRYEASWFFRSAVYGRLLVVLFFIGFVLLDVAPRVLIVFVIVDAAGAGWTALCLRGSDSHDTPTWRSPGSIASSAARLTTHYMENVIDKPGTNEQLLREYIGIYKRFERAIREAGGDAADVSAKRQG